MPLIHEPFDRCNACNHHEFEIRRAVRVTKDSPRDGPLHHREESRYHCASCGYMQYMIREEGGY